MLTCVKGNLVVLSWENYESSSHRCWPHAIRVFLEVFTRHQLSKCSHARVYQQSIKSEIQKFWSDKQDGVGGLTERYDGSRLFGGKWQCRKSIEWETFAPVPGLLNVVCQRQMVKIAKAQLMTKSVTKMVTSSVTKLVTKRLEWVGGCIWGLFAASTVCSSDLRFVSDLATTVIPHHHNDHHPLSEVCIKISTSKDF